jgi:hypothetical protein
LLAPPPQPKAATASAKTGIKRYCDISMILRRPHEGPSDDRATISRKERLR